MLIRLSIKLIVILLSIALAKTAFCVDTMVVTTVESQTIFANSYDASTPKRHINKIDEIDVYKLAPSAYLLAYGHMFDLKGYQKLINNHSRLDDLKAYITAASNKTGVAASLIAAVILVESGAVKEALSPKGAQGLMQLMPETQKELALEDPFDPQNNIEAGSLYLAKMLKMFNYDQSLALAAYNSGPGSVKKYGGIPPFKETKEFVIKVQSTQSQLQHKVSWL